MTEHGGKVGPSSETPGTFGIHRDPRDLLQPPGFRRTPWDLENFSGTTGIPRDVMREKDFSGMVIKFFIFKKLQFFNYKYFPVLNRLLSSNNLLKFFDSLLKSKNIT